MRPANENGSSTTRPLLAEGDQIGSVRQYRGRLDVPHETRLRKCQKHPPSRITLALFETQSCRARKGVVIVVPGFAHGDQPAVGHVVALYSGAMDLPGARATIGSKKANEPVSRYGCSDAPSNSPHDPRHAAERKKQRGPRELLGHPGVFKKSIKPILRDAALHYEVWRMLKS